MEKILIATILKPQGLSGEIKCKLCNPNINILQNITEIYIEGNDVPSRIVSLRFVKDFMFLKLGTIKTREKAELLRNKGVFLNKQALSVPSDEYLISDIIGSEVQSEDNQTIGTLVDIQNYGATDIFVIEQYNRQYMVPFVDDIIKKVYPKQKVIIVNKQKYDEAKVCE